MEEQTNAGAQEAPAGRSPLTLLQSTVLEFVLATTDGATIEEMLDEMPADRRPGRTTLYATLERLVAGGWLRHAGARRTGRRGKPPTVYAPSLGSRQAFADWEVRVQKAWQEQRAREDALLG